MPIRRLLILILAGMLAAGILAGYTAVFADGHDPEPGPKADPNGSFLSTEVIDPVTGMQNGSGMNTHQSLFWGNQNAFFDPDEENRLSMTGKRFIAGLLRHAPEITLVTKQ